VAGNVARYPRYASFIVTGGLVGLLATIVVVLGPGADVDSRRRLFFYLAVLFVGIGSLLGGLVAVLFEERRRRLSPAPAQGEDEAEAADGRAVAEDTHHRP
jgi:hypothetical protein